MKLPSFPQAQKKRPRASQTSVSSKLKRFEQGLPMPGTLRPVTNLFQQLADGTSRDECKTGE